MNEVFCRTEMQITPSIHPSSAQKISKSELLFYYGESALQSITNSGTHTIQKSENATPIKIFSRLNEFQIDSHFFSDFSSKEFDINLSGLSGESYIKFEDLSLASALLNLNEHELGKFNDTESQPSRIRLRFYPSEHRKDGDESAFDEKLIFLINTKIWLARKYIELDLLRKGAVCPAYPKHDAVLISDHYGLKYQKRRSISRGKEMGREIRPKFAKDEDSIELESIFKKMNVPNFGAMLPDAYQGMTIVDSISKSRIVFSGVEGGNESELIRNFTLAHEAIHAITDPDNQFLPLINNQQHGLSSRQSNNDGLFVDEAEYRANYAAAALLIPESVRDKVSDFASPLEMIRWVSEIYKTSQQVALYRLITIGAIEDLPFPTERPEASPSAISTSIEHLATDLANEMAENGIIHHDTANIVFRVAQIGERLLEKF